MGSDRMRMRSESHHPSPEATEKRHGLRQIETNETRQDNTRQYKTLGVLLSSYFRIEKQTKVLTERNKGVEINNALFSSVGGLGINGVE